MKRLGYFTLLPLLAVSTSGRTMAGGTPSVLPNRPGPLVNSLYEQVVSRHSIGVPHGADMDIFGPYLSKALRERLALNNACVSDWRRRHPDPNLKPMGVFEDGLFSGANEQAEPTRFHLEGIRLGKDGSAQAYVRLTLDHPPEKPGVWYVAAAVVSENGHVAVDDILYLKNKKGDVESRLSDRLSSQCDGGRWVGHGQ